MISVCMATKNGGLYLRDQINSILPQLNMNDELIITDDCSVDDTIAIIESYKDERIKLTINSLPKGIAANFETSLKNSSGSHIFLADQDDVWLPDKIQIMMKGLQNADLVICDCAIADNSLKLKQRSFFDFNGSGKGFFKNIIKNSYMGCCMAFKREVMTKALPFPRSLSVHDFWIGMIGELYFKVHLDRNDRRIVF
jgi:glycosyltransferase involved in cell wall biosynthesis